MKWFHCSKRLHNPQTEKLCQDTAEQYRIIPDIAAAQFKEALSSRPLTYWEYVAIRECVSDPIETNQVTAEGHDEPT